MGGLGGKGKGARRRNKLTENAKVYDKKAGTFRYVVEYLPVEQHLCKLCLHVVLLP